MKKEIKEQNLDKVTGGVIIGSANEKGPNGMTIATPPIQGEGLENSTLTPRQENIDVDKHI